MEDGYISALALVVFFGGIIAWAMHAKKKMKDQAAGMVCRDCGTLGNSRIATRGSFLIEAILWICFIVPGLIYTIWRLSSRGGVCASCGSANLIPVDSPMGVKLLRDLGNT